MQNSSNQNKELNSVVSRNSSTQGEVTIHLSDITKYFSGVTALSEVNVAFRAGEVHAILGENGAGKSTLMNIIVGVLQPDHGKIVFNGTTVNPLTPDTAASLGIAISYQHPAILDDLSVLENIQVSIPKALLADAQPTDVARDIMDKVGLKIPLHERCDTLTVAQKQLLEIGKAFVVKPKLLILDEPTASLDQDSTDLLFARIREAVEEGTSVIYITHRLAEIRQIAHRVTVLRDGRVRGGGLVSEVSDEELLGMIAGRTLGSSFPPKMATTSQDAIFSAKSINGQEFKGVSFEVSRGEIVGIAGVSGNGQVDLIRALAGLHSFEGKVVLNEKTLSHRELLQKAVFMPSDRHFEGLAGDLTVRENAALGALDRYSIKGILNRRKEVEAVDKAFSALSVKARSMEASVASLSGGNQQKVVLARALLAEPDLIVADEPTQGVDVGSRAEIYHILRDFSNNGIPVIVNSSDAVELEGLCDKVLVMSRGHIVEVLTGKDVVESRIVAAAVKAATVADAEEGGQGALSVKKRRGWRHFVQLDNAPAIPLAIVIGLLGLFCFSQNQNFLSSFNIANILLLATALGFVAFGQTVALLLGAIDLSVGPLMGFLVIIASFFVNEDASGVMILAGFLLVFGGAVVIGLINGFLIRFANFTAIAATLAMYIGLQGFSFLLREEPGGYISYPVTDIITYQIGPIPVAFIVMTVFALVSEYVLRRARPGWQLRALGSSEESAQRIGLRNNFIYISGFVVVALFTALAAIMLMVQIGVGDPQQGVNYTLTSVTAVVLGGTSLLGGRGTFIGSMLGALLLTVVLNTVSFLGLVQAYQYFFQGALILTAAVIYATARGRKKA